MFSRRSSSSAASGRPTGPAMLSNDNHGADARSYVAPAYQAPPGVPWLHAIHGHVPGHGRDFIFCPEAPQGAFTPTHREQLARLMSAIAPREGSPFAFAIGNLSRDDRQHDPGHGALALIFGFRVSEEAEDGGPQDVPFSHAIVAVDREMLHRTLLDASLALYSYLSGYAEGGHTPAAFYRAYVRGMKQRPDKVPDLLQRYVTAFGKLPAPLPSLFGDAWAASADAPRGRVFILHDPDEPFGSLVHAAAKLVTVLYRSSLRWTAISCGGAVNLPGGPSIEFVASIPADFSPQDRVVRLEDLSDEEEIIAEEFLGLQLLPPTPGNGPARHTSSPPPAQSPIAVRLWDDDEPTLLRRRGDDARGARAGLSSAPPPADPAAQQSGAAPGRASVVEGLAGAPMGDGSHGSQQARDREQARLRAARRRQRMKRWVGASVFAAGLVLAGVTMLGLSAWEERTVDAAPPLTPRPAATVIPEDALLDEHAPAAPAEPRAEAPAEAALQAPAEAPASALAGAPEDARAPAPMHAEGPAQPPSPQRVFGAAPLWMQPLQPLPTGAERR